MEQSPPFGHSLQVALSAKVSVPGRNSVYLVESHLMYSHCRPGALGCGKNRVREEERAGGGGKKERQMATPVHPHRGHGAVVVKSTLGGGGEHAMELQGLGATDLPRGHLRPCNCEHRTHLQHVATSAEQGKVIHT
jgi:hypothetical protein